MRSTLLAGAVSSLVLAACSGPPTQVDPPDAGIPIVVIDAGTSNADAGHTSHPDGGTGLPDAGEPLTWYRDVLPIVQTNCQGCHVESGIAPFALETYAQGFAMHTVMANAVAERRMPPWMPDPDCNSYRDERRLTDDEIDTIVRWSLQGAPEGDPEDAPPPIPEAPGLPWVDVELDAGFDYTPDTSLGADDYHCFILDPGLTTSEDVIGFDIVPGVRRMVHHVLLYSATEADAENKDAQTPGTPGWTCYGGPGTPNPQVVGGWVPGTPVTQYPSGTGIRLPAGSVLVMQVHYNTSTGPAVPDRTKVRLQYATAPVPKQAYIVPQAQTSFAIPPNAIGYTVEVTDPASVPVTVYGVLPHMHQLGRKIRVELTNGGACLVDIPKWDFHWQQFYMFETPIQVTFGQYRKMTCTWDNPSPTRTVTWGEGTADEMCLNYVYVTL